VKFRVNFHFAIIGIQSIDDKIQNYKKAIGQLSEIQFKTLKEILKHLNFMQLQSANNKMSTNNLAVVWNQNLLETTNSSALNEKVKVVDDLITYFSVLFEKIDEECVSKLYFPFCHSTCTNSLLNHLSLSRLKQKEHIFFDVIQKQDEKCTSQSNSNFIIWIKFVDKIGSDKVIPVLYRPTMRILFIFSSFQDFKVILTPNKTVKDVLIELVVKESLNLNDILLKEVISGGDLCRHMYPHEIVLDTVLKYV
jgi:hypothetical protein